MTGEPTLIKVLLRQRHWQKYSTFCAEYDKAAKEVDERLVGAWPSRAQLQRWLSGSVKSRPYPDHCRVLERMFSGWSADQLFRPCPPEHVASLLGVSSAALPPPDLSLSASTLDLQAVFTDRSEFLAAVPPHDLLDSASRIRAVGLSLNLLCQGYPDHHLRKLLRDGANISCLFADPAGCAIKTREQEEGHAEGHLSTLTRLNIAVMRRVRDSLAPDHRQRLGIAVYDETIRFNLLLVDTSVCVMQPYLSATRGVDSPTFLIKPSEYMESGLFTTFEQVFTSLWERSKPL